MNFILFGPMGCGRDTVADYLMQKTDCLNYKISNRIKQMADSLDYKADGEDMRRRYHSFAESCREIFGDYVWNHLLLKQIEQQGDLHLGYGEIPPHVVISDGRKLADLLFWTDDREFVSIGIDTDEEIRRQRLIARDEHDPIEFFKTVMEYESKVCIKECDYRIKNNGTKEELYSQIDKILLTEKE